MEAKPLLGDVALSGQFTVWYAPPNAGKTLLALHLVHDAVEQQRIAAENIYYINADDSSSGLATKLQLMDDIGVHTLLPGSKGFNARDLVTMLSQAAADDQATGLLVIIDTIKKCVSLMDKKESSAFADSCRRFVMRGGTILGLAHTTKNKDLNGKLGYQGTTDILEDFDCSYLLTPLEVSAGAGERIVQFDALKRRAGGPETAAYAYAADANASYYERLASVHLVDLDQLDTFKRVVEEVSDADVIAAIVMMIQQGVVQKMELARASAAKAGVSNNAAMRVIERYTGNDPELHYWSFSVKAHGAKVFQIIQRGL